MPNEKKSILQPKNDVVFKALFSRGKPRITQAMLEAILKMYSSILHTQEILPWTPL